MSLKYEPYSESPPLHPRFIPDAGIGVGFRTCRNHSSAWGADSQIGPLNQSTSFAAYVGLGGVGVAV